MKTYNNCNLSFNVHKASEVPRCKVLKHLMPLFKINIRFNIAVQKLCKPHKPYYYSHYYYEICK